MIIEMRLEFMSIVFSTTHSQ